MLFLRRLLTLTNSFVFIDVYIYNVFFNSLYIRISYKRDFIVDIPRVLERQCVLRCVHITAANASFIHQN